MPRYFNNWVDGFVEATSGRASPDIYRTWAGVSVVGAALQRRCYTHIRQRDMYPNLFILLVAEPGIGKSSAIDLAKDFLSDFKEIKLASSRITGPAFWEELNESAFSITDLENASFYTHHSLTGFLSEFSVFVRRGDLDFMSDLCEMFDCPDPAIYRTKHQGYLRIPKSWFSFISGATPSYLKECFTEAALEGGFPARIIAVFSDEVVETELFGSSKTEEYADLMNSLRNDMAQILKLRGEFIWAPEAAAHLRDWVSRDMRPFPMDTRLKHYNTRRIMHIVKLSMIMSASRGDDMIITLVDLKNAQGLLLLTERTMHKAIGSIGANPYFAAQEAIVKIVTINYLREKKATPEHVLRQALSREVAPYLVEQIIDNLVLAQRLLEFGVKPNRTFGIKTGGEDA